MPKFRMADMKPTNKLSDNTHLTGLATFNVAYGSVAYYYGSIAVGQMVQGARQCGTM